jgi:hypothetical protein
MGTLQNQERRHGWAPGSETLSPVARSTAAQTPDGSVRLIHRSELKRDGHGEGRQRDNELIILG